jgi:hypothetical protein
MLIHSTCSKGNLTFHVQVRAAFRVHVLAFICIDTSQIVTNPFVYQQSALSVSKVYHPPGWPSKTLAGIVLMTGCPAKR